MWDLPGPGLEPMSLALTGGFLTTAPPGKSPKGLFCPEILDERNTIMEIYNNYNKLQMVNIHD